jgi:hypothetical protein
MSNRRILNRTILRIVNDLSNLTGIRDNRSRLPFEIVSSLQ